jgi:glycine dehydrogenase subunit 2
MGLSEPPPNNHAAKTAEPKLIFESGSPGRSALFWPEEERVSDAIPAALLRREIAGFPELGELETLRHFTRLSQRNFAIESQFYPLGSCTMKYNPKINEVVARFPGFAQVHPLTPGDLLQGALALLFELERMLAEISGMEHVSLQPSAGAQGELTGLMLIRSCLSERGSPRRKIIVPDTAHGTNPASSTLCGYQVVQISSNEHGVIDAATVEAAMDQDVAAVMITNPNTLGLFETNIEAIAEVVHSRGGMVYLDGANLNALMGIA